MMEGKEQTTSEGPEQTESSGSKEDSGSDDEASPEQTTDTLGDRIGDSNKPAESAPLSDVSALLDNVSLRPPAIVRSSKSLSDLTAGLFTAPVDTLIADGQSSVGDGPRLSADQSKPYDGVGILRAFSYHLTTDEWLWEKVINLKGLRCELCCFYATTPGILNSLWALDAMLSITLLLIPRCLGMMFQIPEV